MHLSRGTPLSGRALRRLTTKARRGRYVGVTTPHNGGGFVADVREAGVPALRPGKARR